MLWQHAIAKALVRRSSKSIGITENVWEERSMTTRIYVWVAALALTFAIGAVGTVRAGALEELEAVNETSQEAVTAPTDEEAKELSGQGFDTPSQ
jgi:hypothetical protein